MQTRKLEEASRSCLLYIHIIFNFSIESSHHKKMEPFGRYIFKPSECYYDIECKYVIHDSGVFSNKTCRNRECCEDVDPQELLRVQQELAIAKKEAEVINKQIASYIESGIEYVDLSKPAVRYWLLLEIPNTMRLQYNLSYSRDRVVLYNRTK